MNKFIVSILFAFSLIGCASTVTPVAVNQPDADAGMAELAPDTASASDADEVQDASSDTVSPAEAMVDASIPDASACDYSVGFRTYIVESGILVASSDRWQHLDNFVIQNGDNDLVVDQITIIAETIDGSRLIPAPDGASFVEVGIALNGRLIGSASFTSGNQAVVNLTEPMRVPRGERLLFQTWARMAPVVPFSATNGAVPGVARSGAVVALGLANDGIHGLIRAHDEMTGRELHACGTGIISGYFFVVRRSKPTVTPQPLSTTTLVTGDIDLYRFQVSADGAGSIALKRIEMSLRIHSVSGAQICNVRLRRGSTELRWPQDYHIRGPGVRENPEQCWDPSWSELVIYFTDEELITGSGQSYTLHGSPERFMTGDRRVTIVFGSIPDTAVSDFGVVTGYIQNTLSPMSPYDLSLDLSPWNAPNSTMSAAYPGFIWSDLSEVPHSPQTGTNGGSRDWTNGHLVRDLTQSQVLTR